MNQDKTVMSILTLALDREKQGRDFYQEAANSTASEKAKRMFEWLVTVEQTHIQRLTRQIAAVGTTGRFEPMDLPLVQRVTSSDLPRLPKVNGQVDSNTSELDALTIGIGAEREAAAFYSKAAANSTDPTAKSLFQHLAGDEQEHLAILDEEYTWLKKSGEYFTIHRFRMPKT